MNYKRFIREISVEPALFLYIGTHHVINFLNANLFIQKACRFNQTIEPDLDTKCGDQEKGILFTSRVNSIYPMISLLICTVYLILAVCWSDEAGKRRKPLIFLPIFGQFLQATSGCLHSYFWPWSPSSAAFSNMICEIIGGGKDLMIAASQMYICDISNLESRTMRFGLLWLARTISTPLGKGSSGYLVRSFGFFYSYLLCIALTFLSFVFGSIFVRNSSTQVVKKVRIRQIFNLTPVLISFRVVFKKGLASKRIVVVLLLFVYVFGWFALLGEYSVTYLFLKYKFNWDERMYSKFQVYRHVEVVLGTIFCSVLLSKVYKIHDGVIGAFAALCDTIAVIGYALAYETWHLYAGLCGLIIRYQKKRVLETLYISLFDVFHGSALSICSSFMSKFYESHEFGRLHAVIYVFGLLLPICYPVFNIVFQNTMKIFPSAFYVISIVLNSGVVLLYWFSYSLDKKISRERASEAEQESMMSINSPAARIINYRDEVAPK